MNKVYYLYDESGNILDKIIKRDSWQGTSRKTKNMSSKYVGVTYNKRMDKWTSCLGKDCIRINFGGYDNELDAAQAYNEGSVYFYGADAKINIIPKTNYKLLDLDLIQKRYDKMIESGYRRKSSITVNKPRKTQDI